MEPMHATREGAIGHTDTPQPNPTEPRRVRAWQTVAAAMTPLPWPDEATHSRIIRRSRNLGSATALTVAAGCLPLGLGLPAALGNLLVAVLTWIILTRALQTKQFDLGYLITCVTVFVAIYPALFLASGTNHGPMPFFFVFALAVSSLTAQGWRFAILAAAELIDYAVVWLLLAPPPGDDEQAMAVSNHLYLAQMLGCLLAALSLSIGMQFLLRSYLRENLRVNQQNAELARATADKDNFLAVVAHELNTPLSIMAAHADEGRASLECPPGERDWDKAAANMAVISEESRRLGVMVVELLDTARINDGTLELTLRPADLSEIVQQVLTTCAPMCATRGNELGLERGGSSPVVMCDRARLMRVFLNLIANANRHTLGGRITVGVHNQDGFTEVTITDNGEGMDQETLTRVFDPDAVDTPGLPDPARPLTGRGWNGLGLGLRIASYLVRHHGGRLTLESTPGEGTTARFTLPLGS